MNERLKSSEPNVAVEAVTTENLPLNSGKPSNKMARERWSDKPKTSMQK